MELTITAKPRAIFGKQNKSLRHQGFLPAVLYGKGKESLALQVSKKDMDKIFRAAGENTLVNLAIEGKDERKVLIHDVARHFMKNEIIHVDFYEVDLTKKVHIKVPLQFEGLSAAMKEQGGILIKVHDEVEVESLPTNIPQFLSVDIGKLQTFEDVIRVSDIALPVDVVVLTNLEEVIASVQPPRTEEELASLEQSTAEAEKTAIETMTAEAEKEKAEKAAVQEPNEKETSNT